MKLHHITTGFGLELEVWEDLPSIVDWKLCTFHGVPLSWENYLQLYDEVWRPYLQLIRQALEELDWVGYRASDICGSITFHFKGEIVDFEPFTWDEFMSSIVDEGYMAYYC